MTDFEPNPVCGLGVGFERRFLGRVDFDYR